VLTALTFHTAITYRWLAICLPDKAHVTKMKLNWIFSH